MQESSLRAETLLSERLNHDIWRYCDTFLLKKSQYLLTGNATIPEYEDTVVPKMDVLNFVYKKERNLQNAPSLLLGFWCFF